MSRQYPSDWDSRRRKVYRRDNYTCQNCGAKGGPQGRHELHAHHIVPKSKGGTHRLSNLKTVCSRCHNAIHGNATAPTSQEASDTLNQERIVTEATFQHCPVCNSEKIGAGEDDLIVHCAECGLKLQREPDGLSVQEINKSIIDEDSPLRRIDEYTLAEPAWDILAEKDHQEGVDYQRLEQQSKRYEKRMERIRESKIPPALLVGFWLGFLILFNRMLPTLLAWALMLILLIGFAILLLKYDHTLKRFIFRFVA